MSQVSNDPQGISQVISDAGRILFLRRDGILSTGQVVVTNWGASLVRARTCT